MEIIYISAEDIHTDETLRNIISMNVNNYWDSEDDYDFEEDPAELIHAC